MSHAGIKENQRLLDARFHGHDGGETTDFFSKLLRHPASGPGVAAPVILSTNKRLLDPTPDARGAVFVKSLLRVSLSPLLISLND
jgi:hypothetical protein